MSIPNLQAVRDHAQSLFDRTHCLNVEKAHQWRIELPGLTINGIFSSSNYVAYCRKNLVATPVSQGEKTKEITVCIMDSVSQPDIPLIPAVSDEFSIKEFVDYLQQYNIDGACDTNYSIWQYYTDVSALGVQYIKSEENLPPWEPAFPLRQFVHWAYQNSSKGLIHAGTLGINGIGVLLSGAGGAGKSGTTLAGILSGLDSVGDDYVIADVRNNSIKAYPLIKNMKQDLNGLQRNSLDSANKIFNGPNWQNKYVFDFEELGAGRRAKCLDIQAILLPRISNSKKTTIEKISGKEAMLSLAPSNLHQLTGNWQKTMSFAARICRDLPAYRVHLSNNPTDVANSIREFIESTM